MIPNCLLFIELLVIILFDVRIRQSLFGQQWEDSRNGDRLPYIGPAAHSKWYPNEDKETVNPI